MLQCEGYKMFHGKMRINNNLSEYFITGIWLYKPDTDCWYCNGRSYPSFVCSIDDDF